jgi:putative tryptophan/tyrosine transport system substrate-binding protein
MRRRDFITLIGGAAAGWPLAARAQQPTMPVIGWLGSGAPDAFANDVAAFRRGVNESGFVEGKTVATEYRWADNETDRLPALAAELVRRRVAAILASGGALPTRAAKAATSSIPIVFTAPNDPVASGLVASLNRPGGNVTGVNFFLGETWTKLLGLLHQVVPAATVIGLMANSNGATIKSIAEELQTAEHGLGLQLRVFGVGNTRDIDEAFDGLVQQGVGALMVQSGPLLSSHYDQIVSQAARHSLPTICGTREFAAAGGLLSYGASVTDAYHQAGIYIGRILKGEKPADLPVIQPTKLELVINLKTAKALNLIVPPNLLAIADEVIE